MCWLLINTVSPASPKLSGIRLNQLGGGGDLAGAGWEQRIIHLHNRGLRFGLGPWVVGGGSQTPDIWGETSGLGIEYRRGKEVQGRRQQWPQAGAYIPSSSWEADPVLWAGRGPNWKKSIFFLQMRGSPLPGSFNNENLTKPFTLALHSRPCNLSGSTSCHQGVGVGREETNTSWFSLCARSWLESGSTERNKPSSLRSVA